MKFHPAKVPNSSLFVLALIFCIPLSASAQDTTEALKPLKFTDVSFGNITINGVKYEKDVVLQNGEIRERKKGPSQKINGGAGHTPLSHLEKIPWDCDTLVIGIGMSSQLPVTDEFKAEAKKRGVTIIMLQTPEALHYLEQNYGKRTNAIIHVTC